MTFVNFKALLAAYMHRAVADFTIGSIDILGEAINDAKRTAQQEHDFVSLKTRGFLSTSPYGTDISNFKTTHALTTALSVKKVYSCWEYTTDGANATPSRRIMMIADTGLQQVLPTSVDIEEQDVALPVTGKRRVYLQGTKMFLTGAETAETLMYDVIQYLPDFTADADTDIFINEYKSWTQLKALQLLNFYLKEDQRVAISNAIVERQWEAVLRNENRLEEQVDVGDLD